MNLGSDHNVYSEIVVAANYGDEKAGAQLLSGLSSKSILGTSDPLIDINNVDNIRIEDFLVNNVYNRRIIAKGTNPSIVSEHVKPPTNEIVVHVQHPPGFISPCHGPKYPYRGAARPKQFANTVCPNPQPMEKCAPRYSASYVAGNHHGNHHVAGPRLNLLQCRT